MNRPRGEIQPKHPVTLTLHACSTDFWKSVKTKTAPHVIRCDSQYLVLTYIRRVSLSQTLWTGPKRQHIVFLHFLCYAVTPKVFRHLSHTLKMSECIRWQNKSSQVAFNGKKSISTLHEKNISAKEVCYLRPLKMKANTLLHCGCQTWYVHS